MIEVGKIYSTKNSGDLKVLEKLPNKKHLCEFIEPKYQKVFDNAAISRGNCYNPFYPNVCGVGYKGMEKANYFYIYNIWCSILNRCYNPKLNHYKWYGGIGIEVSKKWLNYANFEEWYLKNKEKYGDVEVNVDKDILANINHLNYKLNYSENNCILIPYDLNNFITGDTWITGIRRDFSVKKNGNKIYEARVHIRGKRVNKCFCTFKEAKLWYTENKKIDWLDLIEKTKYIPNYIKELLLKYDFSWYWIWENWSEEEILNKIELKQNFK